MPKLIQRNIFLIAKNKKHLININLLLLTVNLIIASFFD